MSKISVQVSPHRIITVNAVKCEEPKRRTDKKMLRWDGIGYTLPAKFLIITDTWNGSYAYFENHEGQWYKFSLKGIRVEEEG